jgi:hypothetical protein
VVVLCLDVALLAAAPASSQARRERKLQKHQSGQVPGAPVGRSVTASKNPSPTMASPSASREQVREAAVLSTRPHAHAHGPSPKPARRLPHPSAPASQDAPLRPYERCADTDAD